MTITKEYCDRCGKQVDSEPLNCKLLPIICRSPKRYIRFRDKPGYIETTHMVCEDCMNGFIKWWEQQ